jgi:predicted esterase
VTPVAHHLVVPRTARYVTEGEIEAAEEVWFVLHGYSMLASSFLTWFEAAARPGRLLVAPEGLSRAYFEEGGARRVGASWMTREDREVEIEDYVRYLDLLADRVLGAAARDARVEVHGFSQGTATACRWLGLGRLRASRLVLWAGGVPPDLPLDRLRAALLETAFVIALGSRDRYVSEADVEREAARLAAAGITPELRRFEGGHRVDRGTLSAFATEAP